MPPLEDRGGAGGGGGVVVASSADLRSLSTSAIAARQQLEGVVRQAGGVIGGLDGRGWDLGAVQGKWSTARATMAQLADDLGLTAIDLLTRAELVDLFENGPGFGVPFLPGMLQSTGSGPGSSLPAYAAGNLGDLADIFFPKSGFGEATFDQDFRRLLDGKPTSKRLFNMKGSLNDYLSPTAAAIAERARQLALKGSPAGAGRKLNAIDKLDPSISYNLNLLDANASVWSYGVGGPNASLTLEALAAHAHASAGLSLDLKRRRLSANVDIGAEADLFDAHAHAGGHLGSDMLGTGGEVTADASAGANADARAGLTLDALKGRGKMDLGADAFAGLDASAEGSAEADVGGAKTTISSTATGYAGVGIGVKADGNLDLLHGKFGFHGSIGAALGVGGKLDFGLDVDVSGVPQAIGDAASDVGHALGHLVPHIHFP